MRKKMLIAFIRWLFLCVLMGGVAIFTDSVYAMTAILFLLVLPVLCWGLNLAIRKNLTVQIKIVPTASKKQGIRGTVRVENASFFSTGCMYISLGVVNVLTGEMEECLLDVSVPSSGAAEGEFELASAHCGYVRTMVEKAVLTDWFGFLPLSCSVEAGGKTSVLPDTFLPQVSIQMSYAKADEVESWSPIQKGQDYTEVFSLRDYVEGDSLKQIHWKLSSKRNQLIVKEPSLPTTKSLLLFWDKNAAKADAREMDVLAETASSIAQAVSEQGITYCLGWTEGKNCEFENVENGDDLLQVIPRMIKTGRDGEAQSGAHLCAQIPKTKEFAKVIYFAKDMPEDFCQIGSGDMTMILCGGTGDGQWPVHTCHPDTYLTDLQAVEL